MNIKIKVSGGKKLVSIDIVLRADDIEDLKYGRGLQKVIETGDYNVQLNVSAEV